MAVSAAEIKRDIEQKTRHLMQQQSTLAAVLKSSQDEDGKRTLTPSQAEQIRYLEADCVKHTDLINSLKFDYIQARTEEDLARNESEALETPRMFSGAPMDDGGAAKAVVRVPKSLGDAFVESQSYKTWNRGGMNQNAYVELPIRSMGDAMKATITTSGLTSYERPPGTILIGQQELTVADLFSQATTTAPTIRYLHEVSFTNAATAVSEGSAKPEASWSVAEVDAAVRKIAVIAKVTDELFADFPAIRAYINDRLPFMVRQREELLLLDGDGIAPNILGVLRASGVLTQAKGSDTNVDAIYKGITKVRTQGFFEPDAVVIDPTNWTPIRLLKTTTGEYVWGDPSAMGPETIFGKRVVVTANMLDNTALVGAFKIGGTVYYREGLRVEATNSNEDDFETNLITLRAEQREALVVWRGPAFCKVTGLDAG